MKRHISFFTTIILLLALVLPVSCLAIDKNGGWELAFVMKSDTGGRATLNPSSMFIDATGEKYYVVDSGNNRLLSFSIQGDPLLSFNAGGKLNKPVSMAKNDNGILLVVEKGKEGITKIDLANKVVNTVILQHKGRKLYPQKIRYLKGTIYFLEKSSGSIFSLSPEGAIIQKYLCDSCAIGFTDFQVIQKGIMALSQQEGEIVSFDEDGNVNKKIQLRPKPEFPISFTINRDGDFFVVERHAGRISVYDAKGTFRYALFSKGEKEGSLYYPIEVQFDALGRLCVVEEGNGRVSVFTQ